jgi:hypothetical protein
MLTVFASNSHNFPAKQIDKFASSPNNSTSLTAND